MTKKAQNIVSLGKTKIIREGIAAFDWSDFYHLLFTLSWFHLFLFIAVIYITVNAIFAGAYLLGGDCIENAQPGSFIDAFFFSVQTTSTIGYGSMYPKTAYSNTLVVIEVFLGLLGMAIATGLMFARFSRPTARIIFSNIAVICPYNGIPTLMFRTANQRRNFIVEAQIKVSLLLPEETPEGHIIRRLHDINLVRSSTPMFTLSWMVMHPIDETSPLFGLTATDLQEKDAQLIVTMVGLDDSLGQTVHARYQYLASEVVWNARFVDVVTVLPGGDRKINYRAFHEVVMYEEE